MDKRITLRWAGLSAAMGGVLFALGDLHPAVIPSPADGLRPATVAGCGMNGPASTRLEDRP